MLIIRFNRSGRANSAFFRIVVTESSKPPKSGFIKVLGWYNPHTKDSSVNKEEILRYLDNGAQVSNSLAKLLGEKKITHKLIKFIPNAQGKKKGEEKEVKPKSQVETADKTIETTTSEITEENKTEETPMEETAAGTSKSAEVPTEDVRKESAAPSSEAEEKPKSEEKN